jgi:hypothetical protein
MAGISPIFDSGLGSSLFGKQDPQDYRGSTSSNNQVCALFAAQGTFILPQKKKTNLTNIETKKK